jgi:hypothetical protein
MRLIHVLLMLHWGSKSMLLFAVDVDCLILIESSGPQRGDIIAGITLFLLMLDQHYNGLLVQYLGELVENLVNGD